MNYDTIIIGGGPAGLTGALYLARYERKILLLTEITGGQTTIAGVIENYPGFVEINGAELIAKMREQVAKQPNAEFKEGEKVEGIVRMTSGFLVKTAAGEYQAKTILAAGGRRHRELGMGENKLIGKGISYCATCDSTFARGKDVIIIGGGYAAGEAALILTKLTKSLTVLNLNEALTGEKITLGKITNDPKIKVINNAGTTKIIEKNGLVGGAEYKDTKTGSLHKLECQMIFIEIGQIPNTEVFSQLVKLNESGEIIIDCKTNTAAEGIYAAGDISDIAAKQTVVACGEGAKAAIAINKYLESMP